MVQHQQLATACGPRQHPTQLPLAAASGRLPQLLGGLAAAAATTKARLRLVPQLLLGPSALHLRLLAAVAAEQQQGLAAAAAAAAWVLRLSA
jgi:hypothetical protein